MSDTDARVIMDLREMHGLHFTPANKKDSMEMGVNLVRTMISGGQLEIHESCELLRHQLRNGTWNKARTDLARTSAGHNDLVAALVYLCRAVDRQRSPFPEGYRVHRAWETKPLREQASNLERGLLPDTPFGRRVAEAQRAAVTKWRRKW